MPVPHRNRRARRSGRFALAAAFGGVLVILAACSSTGGASTAASQSAAASGGSVVKLSGLAFDPTTLSVPVGSKVTFRNMDGVAHTVTNGKDGKPGTNPLFDQAVPAGTTFDFTFTTAGTFTVTCKIHNFMNLTVTVH
jgi:plastocyanin